MSEHETNAEETTEQVSSEEQQTEMSTATATLIPDQPFDRTELEEFDASDTTAGAHIGKMLALLFFYTVIVMSIVGYWTFSVVSK